MPQGHGDAADTAIASAKVVGVVTAFNGGRVSPVIDGMVERMKETMGWKVC